MEESQLGVEEERELFMLYTELLNQEFHDKQNTKDAMEECISIAQTLLESGFVIILRFAAGVETVNPSDDTVQTIITRVWDLALFKHQMPIGKPIATAEATTKIFGLPAPIDDAPPISKENEAWLRSVLGSAVSNKPDTNFPQERN